MRAIASPAYNHCGALTGGGTIRSKTDFALSCGAVAPRTVGMVDAVLQIERHRDFTDQTVISQADGLGNVRIRRECMAIFPNPLLQLDGSNGSLIGDETLMRDITRRRPHALKALYSRYSHLLRGLIGSVVHEESEADDVLQESFLQIWREAHHYSPKAGKPLGWIITIARRRAIDRVRRRDSYRRAKQRFEEELAPQPSSNRLTGTAFEASQSDLRSFLGRHMQALPRVQREAVELAYFKGLSQREIAATTRTPLGTVKTRLQLGLRKLTQCVGPLRDKV
jgi:RNA polymerase sigma-70 factor (ECF subfamily)